MSGTKGMNNNNEIVAIILSTTRIKKLFADPNILSSFSSYFCWSSSSFGLSASPAVGGEGS